MSWRARLSVNLRELNIYTHKSATPVYNWMSREIPTIEMLNPHLPIALREIEEPKSEMSVRYDWNEERTVDLMNLSEAQIEQKLKELVELGETMERAPESAPKDRDIIDEIDVRFDETY